MASRLLSSSSWCEWQSKSTLSSHALFSLLSKSPGKLVLSKFGLIRPNYSSQVKTIFNFSKFFAQGLQSSSGKKILRGCSLGLGITTAMMYQPSNIAYAMQDLSSGHLAGTSADLKDDFNRAWALARKYQLPLVMLMMLLLGWRRPFVTAINALFFLFCTRPNPFSIYLFIEHLRKREMQHDPSLSKTKLLYARKIEVQDYKLVCYGQVELRDQKLHLLGLLGGWWIIHVSPI